MNGRPIDPRFYGIAVRIVDTEAELSEILTQMMPAINEAVQAEAMMVRVRGVGKTKALLDKAEETANAFGQLAREYHDVLVAMRDLLRARGWGAPPVRTIASRGTIADWEPRRTKDADLVRVTFDAREVTAGLLSDLWEAGGHECEAAFTFRQRQLELGETPPAADLDRLMELHTAGEHNFDQDPACPACLAEATERRLREEPDEGGIAVDADEGPPDLNPKAVDELGKMSAEDAAKPPEEEDR